MSWQFGDLKPLSYRVILADPAWLFKLRSEKGEAKSPQAQYDCMSLEDIKALRVWELAAGDAVLVLWGTFPMLRQAMEVMDDWRFEYKTGGAWAKKSPTGRSWNMGPGYILRSAAEIFLVGTIGKPRILSRSERNLLDDPVRGHSRKPASMREKLERLFDGPYCELFSRSNRPGWATWGNETGKFDPE